MRCKEMMQQRRCVHSCSWFIWGLFLVLSFKLCSFCSKSVTSDLPKCQNKEAALSRFWENKASTHNEEPLFRKTFSKRSSLGKSWHQCRSILIAHSFLSLWRVLKVWHNSPSSSPAHFHLLFCKHEAYCFHPNVAKDNLSL